MGAAMNLGQFLKMAALAGLSPVGGSSGRSSWDGEPDVAPNLSDFAWTNQSGAVAEQRNGYFSMLTTDKPSTDTIRILTVPAPGVPYTATARMQGLLSVNYHGYGMCMMDTIAGQMMTHGTLGSTFHVAKWAAPTVFLQAEFNGSILHPRWLRVRDDGTNLYADMSSDGHLFANVWSGPRTYLPNGNPPNRVGIYLHSVGAQAQCSLHSWKVTTP